MAPHGRCWCLWHFGCLDLSSYSAPSIKQILPQLQAATQPTQMAINGTARRCPYMCAFQRPPGRKAGGRPGAARRGVRAPRPLPMPMGVCICACARKCDRHCGARQQPARSPHPARFRWKIRKHGYGILSYHCHIPIKHCRAYISIRRTERIDAAVARPPVKRC